MKTGDRAVFIGGEKWLTDLNERYSGKMCTILEMRGNPFGDCKVAFDDFPQCNYRENCNWFYVGQDTLQQV